MEGGMNMVDQSCQEEYIRRIHKVQDYMEQHMGQNLTIDELADIAGFSKFHFSRIFHGVINESLAHYVNRIRLENSLFLLAHRKDKNITDIAYELGFSDSAVFSRAFKNYFGTSPREYRQEYSKNCKDSIILSEYNVNTAKKEWTESVENRENATIRFHKLDVSVTIEHQEKKQLAYVRHTGTYDTLAQQYEVLIDKLFEHAARQGLLREGQNDVIAIYHDNPEFGEQDQFRTSLCITVPDGIHIAEDGVLGKMELLDGLYVVGHFRIKQQQFPDAWDYMYREWLTFSGYVPRNASPFELYRNAPGELDENYCHVDIYVPIEPILF